MTLITDKWTTEYMPFRDTELENGTRIVATRWPATIVGRKRYMDGSIAYLVIYDDAPQKPPSGAYAHNIDAFIYDYPRPLPHVIMEGR